jgi:hypothetical protein
VNTLAASLNPLRVLDALTDRLGAFLIEMGLQMGALTKHVATLPAWIQVMVTLSSVAALGFMALMTLKALGRGRGIVGDFRKASTKQAEAKEALPVADWHRAKGYVMAVGLMLVMGVLLLFLVQSWRASGKTELPENVPTIGGFSGR